MYKKVHIYARFNNLTQWLYLHSDNTENVNDLCYND